jgi:hypothetical protein
LHFENTNVRKSDDCKCFCSFFIQDSFVATLTVVDVTLKQVRFFRLYKGIKGMKLVENSTGIVKYKFNKHSLTSIHPYAFVA